MRDLFLVIAAPGAGQKHGGHTSLEVLLPRPDGRLVKVVYVKDQPPVWRSVHAKVVDVGVPAYEDPAAAKRAVAQVRGHRSCRPPEVAERVLDHPAHAQRHQILQALLVLLFQDFQGVAVRGCPIRGLRFEGHLLTGVLASRNPLALPTGG